MTVLVLQDFMGMRPKRDKRVLPGMSSQSTANCKLWSGAIDPLKQPLPVFTPTKTGTIQSMYRMDDRVGGSDIWLHWPFDVDAIRGVVVDTRQRLYYTGEYEPRVTTYEMAVDGVDTVDGADNYPAGFGETGTNYPLAFYALGVPNPPIKGQVSSVTGGSAADVTRAYLYTLVNAWGEESGPSPAFTFTGKPDGTWNLEIDSVAPLNTDGINYAVHASGVVTVYADAYTSLKKGHRITIASVVDLTDLNATFTVASATNLVDRTVSRERTSNVATLEFSSVEGLAVGDRVTIAGVTGAEYNGTGITVTGVNTTTNTITYASVAGNEGNTADTGGIGEMGKFTVALTTAQSYTSGGTWTREAPWNVANMKKRIYRTLTGNAETIYQFVVEIAATTITYADSIADTALQEELVTLGYDTPPGDMHSIVEMANGMTAGARDNEVLFATAYSPYSWPVLNFHVLNWDIVGLVAFGQSVVAATKGKPYLLTGVEPQSVSSDDIGAIYPCMSKRGIDSLGWGVVYPCDQGLVMITQKGSELVTRDYYTRDEWQSLANGGVFASSMIFDNRYYAFWLNSQGNGECLIFDPAEPNAVVTQNNEQVDAAWADPETGIGYVVDSNDVVSKWDADDARRQTYQWKSKEFKYPKPINFGACRMEGTFTLTAAESAAITAENTAITARNQVIIDSIPSGAKRAVLRGAMGSGALVRTWLNTSLAAKTTVEQAGTILERLLNAQAQFMQFEIFADGVSKYTKTVTEESTFRLPGGYKSHEYEFNITGNVRTQAVKMAGTMLELEEV